MKVRDYVEHIVAVNSLCTGLSLKIFVQQVML